MRYYRIRYRIRQEKFQYQGAEIYTTFLACTLYQKWLICQPLYPRLPNNRSNAMPLPLTRSVRNCKKWNADQFPYRKIRIPNEKFQPAEYTDTMGLSWNFSLPASLWDNLLASFRKKPWSPETRKWLVGNLLSNRFIMQLFDTILSLSLLVEGPYLPLWLMLGPG